MSIRLRLILLYSVILALVLIAFNVILYITLSRATLNLVQGTLQDESQRLLHARGFRPDKIDYPAKKFAAPETYVQTLDINGDIADRTLNLGAFNLPLSPEGHQVVWRGQPWSETAPTEQGRVLIYSAPILYNGQVGGAIQVARSLVEQDQSLNTLRSFLIVGSGLTIIAAFGIGWILAGTALRPINQITQTAQTIGAERDFDRRVDYTGPNDEIGQLATTFNAMLTELQAGYRQVEQTLLAQRRFVADASHELRTPLTTLRGNIGLLQREPPISLEDRKAVLADMVIECERLIRLVHNLLALARSDAGRPLRSEPVLIKPLVEEVCRQARLLDPTRQIHCETLLDARVKGDPDALKQVLLVLLDNALKFTPPQGRIEFSVRANNGNVDINVCDTGPGIGADVLPHIFERFYRIDTSRTGGGAGLGLSIAKSLIEAQHGRIAVESQEGAGSTFTITLSQSELSPS
jgi:signal transduction histidine kinase